MNFIAFKKLLVIGIIVLNAPGSAFTQGNPMHDHHQQTGHSPNKNVLVLMMDTMMLNMDTVKTGISPDHDFMLQMIPHHQGAIEMARYEIENGKNFQMVQLAKSILAEQAVEIQQMQAYTDLFLAVDYPLKEEFKKEMDETMEVMMRNMPSDLKTDDVDAAFAIVMIPHHQAGIDMARVILRYSSDNRTIGLAKQIITSQEVEIRQMSSLLNKYRE